MTELEETITAYNDLVREMERFLACFEHLCLDSTDDRYELALALAKDNVCAAAQKEV